MIVVAGGSGRLGHELSRRLVARGERVRVLTRDVDRARAGLSTAVPDASIGAIEVVAGDVREPSTLAAAVAGADVVVSAIQGFGGHDAGGLQAVDADGNAHLIEAASQAGVGRFVLLSMQGAGPTSPFALGRAKGEAEAALRAASMAWTIVRPSTYMETWAGIVGGPILASGKARLFGSGRNPINFVSARDVAAVVERAVVETEGSSRVLELRGPEDLTFDEVVGRFEVALGRAVPIGHVPRPMLRLMAVGLRLVRPALAEQVAAAIVMDTADLRGGSIDAPGTPPPGTTFDSVIRAFVAAAQEQPATSPAA
jgi:uncharacterized protein YbjT (DUF2867 family)